MTLLLIILVVCYVSYMLCRPLPNWPDDPKP